MIMLMVTMSNLLSEGIGLTPNCVLLFNDAGEVDNMRASDMKQYNSVPAKGHWNSTDAVRLGRWL